MCVCVSTPLMRIGTAFFTFARQCVMCSPEQVILGGDNHCDGGRKNNRCDGGRRETTIVMGGERTTVVMGGGGRQRL